MEKREVCWLITTKCNQSCKYCHSFLNIKDLPYDENKKILIKLIKAGVNYITWSGGEALLYPNLIELLKIAKQYGIKNKLITNGAIIGKEKKMQETLKYLDTITLSIDTTNNIINEQMGRGAEHFKEIKNVLNILKGKQIKININTVITKMNKDHLEELGDFLNNNKKINEWRIFKFAPLREVAKNNQKLFDITEKEFEIAKEKVKQYKNIRNIKYRDNNDMESKYNLITADGNIIRTINREDVVLGNLLKMNLNEILSIISDNTNRDYSKDKIKVLIYHNDTNILNRITKAIKNLNNTEIVATANNVNDTFNDIIRLQPDMVFSKFNIEIIKCAEESLYQNMPVFNFIDEKIEDKELKKAIEIGGNKINSIIDEPFERKIEDILNDYKNYLYK